MYTKRSGWTALILLLTLLAVAPANASVLFFHGNLRTNANVTGCDVGCSLAPGDSDAAWAQWAAVVYSFAVPTPSFMSAITYSYGGGHSLTGPTVFAGGFEPYLSLFDAGGNFLASTYFGTTCPPGAHTVAGGCYDVSLGGGLLSAGTYQIAITSWWNMSFAENLFTGTLADGFTGLGHLNGAENLNYAFDVILAPASQGVPEPATPALLLAGLALIGIARRRAAIAD